MFVPHSAIVTYTLVAFQPHCTYEAWARAHAARVQVLSHSLRRQAAFTAHVPTTCSSATKNDHFFPPQRTRQAEGAGWNVPCAQFQELHFLSHSSIPMTQQSTAAVAEPVCFHSQRMTLSSFRCTNSIANSSAFLQGQIRNPLVFATALLTVGAHVLQCLAFERLALRVLRKHKNER